MIDNVLTFGTFHLLVTDQPLIPVSFCQVWRGCQFLSLPLCSVRWGLQDCRCTACLPTTGGPQREWAHISPSSWLIKTFSCSSPSSLLQPHTAAHTTLITPIKLWFTVFTPSSCPHCGYRESEEWPSPPCPQCSQHPAKCEPIGGGGWSAKPQSASSRWQPSLWWLGSQRSVNNTWPGPAAHSNWGYIPGNTLMNN